MGGATVGDHDEEWPAAWVADPLDAQHLGRGQQALGERRTTSGRQVAEAPGGDVDRVGRRQRDLGRVAAEGDQPDLVAALVGVEQQAEDRGLDLLHPLARGHRAGRVDAEEHEVGLAPLAPGGAEVAGLEPQPTRAPAPCPLVRGGGPDRLDQVEPARAGRVGADPAAVAGQRATPLPGLARSGPGDLEPTYPVGIGRSDDRRLAAARP